MNPVDRLQCIKNVCLSGYERPQSSFWSATPVRHEMTVLGEFCQKKAEALKGKINQKSSVHRLSSVLSVSHPVNAGRVFFHVSCLTAILWVG